ncbi:MAG: hypothetical protein M3485_06280, partial [Pseudomonadota bacterium]|nr:hypothetical protein [Pseudomonadota bacterium]
APRQDDPRRSASAQAPAQSASQKPAGTPKKTRGRRGPETERKAAKVEQDTPAVSRQVLPAVEAVPGSIAANQTRSSPAPAPAGAVVSTADAGAERVVVDATAPPADEVQTALGDVSTASEDTATQTQDDSAGEAGSGRRRRGRRGGRRRRRGGEGSTSEDSSLDEAVSGEDAALTDRSQPEFDFDDGAQAPAEDKKPRPSRQKAPVAEPASAEAADHDAPEQGAPEQDAPHQNGLATTNVAASAFTADAPLAGRVADDSNRNPPAGLEDQTETGQAPLASPSYVIGQPSEHDSGTRTETGTSTPPPRIVHVHQDPIPNRPSAAERPRADPHIAAVTDATPTAGSAPADQDPDPASAPPATSTADAGIAVARGLFDAVALPVPPASPAEAAAEAVAGRDSDEDTSVDDAKGAAATRHA